MFKVDIFEPMVSHPMAHASTLTELPDGDLLCAFYAGSYETAPDQAIFIAKGKKRPNGNWDWEKPIKLIDTMQKANGNPVLFTAPDGTVWLFFVTLEGSSWTSSLLFATKSRDSGRTWTEPQLLSAVQGTMPRTKPLVLEDGTWLLPLYDERAWKPIFWLSEDEGQNWHQVRVQTRLRLIQPAVVELSDGTLLAYCRSNAKRIFRLVSKDKGKSWTEPEPTFLPNPNSAVDIAKLPDGSLVLAFNDSVDNRTPLTIAFSTDEIERWTVIRDLEVGEGEFSYPCLLVASDGNVHCTYTYRRRTIRHSVFGKNWLTGS
ncbi:MAG: exo-alpha-sialidase [Armatimonadetes bacterium]|nr:exo-alpha-sialidase [Armatimonadota bacterium]MDW8028025.1 sialidase family protein [Armatimonadota bacterium]